MAEILIMAMTRMQSGICTAGFTTEKHPESRLCWVRPVKEYGSLLLGDMTTAEKEIVRVGDVVELALLAPRPQGSYVEDWLTDFVHSRPQVLRRLEGEKRASFLAGYCDRNPVTVLCQHRRSLCLICPDEVWARFSLDHYSGKYESRIGFHLLGLDDTGANTERGIPVTDLKWRALGRRWLADGAQPELLLPCQVLLDRLGADQIYLSVGLSRPFQGKQWLLVVGVHPVPDYEVEIDYGNL